MVKKQLWIPPERNHSPFYSCRTEAQRAIFRDDTGPWFPLKLWDSGTFQRTTPDWLMPNLYRVAVAAFSLKWGSPRPQRRTDHYSPACCVVHKPPHVPCKAPSPRAWGKSLTCITVSSSPLNTSSSLDRRSRTAQRMQDLPIISSFRGMSALQDLGPFSSQTEVMLVLESFHLASGP